MKQQKIWIYGTGSCGKRAFEALAGLAHIVGFIDTHACDDEAHIFDLPLTSPTALKTHDFDYVVIASQFQDEILATLQDCGIPTTRIALFPIEGQLHTITLPDNIKDVLTLRSHRDIVYQELYSAVEYIFGSAVDGDIAEFGAGATGHSSLVLAKALADCSQYYRGTFAAHGLSAKQLYYFDSFSGMPDPADASDQASPHVASGVWGGRTMKIISDFDLSINVNQYLHRDQFHIKQGWFEETLSGIPPGKQFALIHLDCDLYLSTYQVLDYLISHQCIADGCLILFDDWNCNRASNKYGQRRAWNQVAEEYNLDFSDLGYYAMAGKKFIIHRDR